MDNSRAIQQAIDNNRSLAQRNRQEAEQKESQAQQKRQEAQNMSTQIKQDAFDLVAVDLGTAETAHDAYQVASKRGDKKELEQEAEELQREADKLRQEADKAEKEAYNIEQLSQIAEKDQSGSDTAAAKAEAAAKNSVSMKSGTGLF